MNIDQVKQFILGTRPDTSRKGRAFQVTFVKANGEVRAMRARLGVTKGVTGKGQPFNPADHNLVTVWELGNGFRNIPLKTVRTLRVPDNSKHLKTVVRESDYIFAGPGL